MAKKKLKIAFVSFYSGSVYRGGEIFIHELANRLSENHDVTLFQAGPKQKKANYKIIKKEIYLDWDNKDMTGSLRRRWFTDYWSIKIAQHAIKIFLSLVRGKYDVIIPLDGGWQCAFVRIASKFGGAKMVISGQSGIGWDDRNNLWSFPDYFIAISKPAEKWAKKAMPFVKTTYIPNGVDLKRFTPNGKKFKHNLGHPVVLSVSALIPSKRVDLTIEAIGASSDLRLLVVGDGFLKEKLMRQGNKILKKRISFISAEHSTMPSIYRSADVFVFVPNESEAFGIVLVEAMAVGLPVVTIDDPIRKEIVGNAGLITDPNNKKMYLKQIRNALKTNWGEMPRKQAEKYSWDLVTKRYEQLLSEII